MDSLLLAWGIQGSIGAKGLGREWAGSGVEVSVRILEREPPSNKRL